MSINYKELAQDVFKAQNKVRTNPSSFIPQLNEMAKLFKGNDYYKPGEITLMTQEGASAVNELIRFLEKAHPLSSLSWSDEMARAADDHAKDIGHKGISSHTGSDHSSMSDRMERYGEWMGKIGENIDFGSINGEEIIINLLVDDGNLNRGHRKNIFEAAFRITGIACASHEGWRHCCVLDYAEEYTSKGGVNPKSPKTSENVLKNQQELPNINLISMKYPEEKKDLKAFELKKEIDSGRKKTDESKNNVPKKKKSFGCFGFGGGDNKQKAPVTNSEIKTNHNDNENKKIVIKENEQDPPQGYVSLSTKKETKVINGVSETKETKVYTMADGSSKTMVKVI